VNGRVLDAPDGTYTCIEEGVVLPNGISFSPDGKTRYVTEMWAT
jgi:sugar lactone lactonase YvrE